MLWQIISTALFTAWLAGTGPALPVAETDSFAVRAGWLYTLSGEGATPLLIRDGVLIIRSGKIEAVGDKDLPIPAGLELLDFGEAVVLPGLVSADSSLVFSRGGDETLAAKYRALDDFDLYQEHRQVLAGGITTAYLHPGTSRLVSGVGAVVKIAGPVGPNRILKEAADLVVNLGERSFNPPALQDYPLPPSSVNKGIVAEPQRPSSRLGQYLELRETFAKARALHESGRGMGAEYDYNLECLARTLALKPLLRIDARRARDLEGACRFLKEEHLRGILTGALESPRIIPVLKKAGVSVIFEVPLALNQPGRDRHPDSDPLQSALEGAQALAEGGVPFALTLPRTEKMGDLMLAAAASVRGGLSVLKALEAITRVPAEILGVDHRVGSLVPGKDADFLVLSGRPLKRGSHVRKVFSQGREVFSHPAEAECLVIRAGAVLTAAGTDFIPGEVLVEEGRIRAVGRSVPCPPGARIVDAGHQAVVTPGFIDGHGHLGLEGDRSSVSLAVSPVEVLGVPGPGFHEVARAGITTVVLSPWGTASSGTRMSAIKTAGAQRADLVVDDLAALKFSFRNKDPLLGIKSLESALKGGKAYADSWIKYEEALKKWQEDQAKGIKQSPEEEKPEAKKPEVEEEAEEKADPITGTWDYTVSGGPMPEPRKGTMKLLLEENRISGTVLFALRGNQEYPVTGTLDDTKITLELDMDMPGAQVTVEGELDREDHFAGKLIMGQYFELDLEAERIEKAPPRLKVSLKKKGKEDGRPEPPEVNPALEPYRRLFRGEVPALVDAGSQRELRALIKLFVETYKVPLGLLGAEQGDRMAEALKQAGLSVVLPARAVTVREGKPFLQGDALSRQGVPVIFQSAAGDGARTLPLHAAYQVYQGMGAHEALLALTLNAARFYRIDDRVGSLEKGKDADLLIFSGDPFEIGSRVERVFISGKEVTP